LEIIAGAAWAIVAVKLIKIVPVPIHAELVSPPNPKLRGTYGPSNNLSRSNRLTT